MPARIAAGPQADRTSRLRRKVESMSMTVRAALTVAAFAFASFATQASAGGPQVPSAEHQWLQSWVGEWSIEHKRWKKDAKKPEVVTGVRTCTAGLEGLAIDCVDKIGEGPKAFRAHFLMTWNARQQKYQRAWADSYSDRGLVESFATLDDSKMNLTEHTEYPGTGGRPVLMRAVTRIDGKNKRIKTVLEPAGEGEHKSMEITFTRK